MKKLLLSLIALVLSTMMMAGNFVTINYSGQAELERLFADRNLTIHYYNDSQVFATAEQFDANTMTMIDENAFQDCEVYTIIYSPEPVIHKGPAQPLKNDGAVAIFNKKAQLPSLTREFPVITSEDPRIREMMDQVNMDSLEATVQHLQDYQNRFWNTETAFAASDWIASKMQALGLEVEQQAFNANTWMGSGQAAPNVIGIQRGTLYPDVYVVCGSHFDSFSYELYYGSGSTCPGADDNATGVASVLESARILTQYEFEYSIIYCCYGCEEMGLYGSEAYATRCQQQGMEILGYFNNDMNGYLYGDQIHIHCIYPNSAAPIGDYYMNVANVYFPDMPVEHKYLSGGDSDHTSFNNHGYMGIYPFEDVDHYSPYIHTSNDLIGNSVNSFAMSQRYCQMNIGCLTEIANPVGETPISCNPVVIFEIPPIVFKEDGVVIMNWDTPEEGSTGELEHFDVYRNDTLIATVDYDPTTVHYSYTDMIPVDTQADYFIMAVYSDGCEAPSETLTGTSVSVGLQESWMNSIEVYPNPVENQLTIKAEGLQRIVIFNVMGQQVANIEAKQDEVNIGMDAYSKGLYTLQIITGNGLVNKNIIVK